MPPRKANPTAPVTQADLAVMEQRYQNMLQADLTPFHAAQQTQTTPLPAPGEAQPAPVQLSAKAKHLRDFRKYMKCHDDQKVQCAVFFLEDRGIEWWKTAERMLGGDVSKITWEQFKKSFYAKFFSANVKYAKQQKFLNLEMRRLGDVDSINNLLHVPGGPFTKSKAKKIQDAFTLHVQKLANAQRETKNFELKFLYNVSSAIQEEHGVKMARDKLCNLEDDTRNEKSVQNL
ncbi:gag protease polyprotein [Cucumis melo var. makuwa]|uniref:Gag protease polyprotein n=1 Tax=Cucumis melo var. makuwa TaxID=1194695 RepID=A0A5A7UPI4_CUCMM|nr:gag protease polyprotein [Cucumis melo var. makuwa]TYJ97098.1 gag protease polyprotein [Cucumis melo var. makuwa]